MRPTQFEVIFAYYGDGIRGNGEDREALERANWEKLSDLSQKYVTREVSYQGFLKSGMTKHATSFIIFVESFDIKGKPKRILTTKRWNLIADQTLAQMHYPKIEKSEYADNLKNSIL